MTEYTKLVNHTIFSILLLICLAFSLFLIINWNFISNPELVPGYVKTQAIFSYGRDHLAKYRHWTFHYPMAIIPYVMYLEGFLLAHLIRKKNMRLTKLQWLALLGFLVFMIFSDFIFNNVSIVFNSDVIRQLGYRFNDFLLIGFYTLFLFLLIVSILLMFSAKFINYRKFLFLNLCTVVLSILLFFAHVSFFFD